MADVTLDPRVEAKLERGQATLAEFLESVKYKLMRLTGVVKPEESEIWESEEEIQKTLHLPYLLISKPGIGKTEGLASLIQGLNDTIMKEHNIKIDFIPIPLGQTLVGDLNGIPVPVQKDGNTDIQRVITDDLPVPGRDSDFGVLFLDEITTADKQQMQPALSLCDDRRGVGSYKLPDGWLVVAAGNGPDCTNFERLDFAMISRFRVFRIPNVDYELDWKPWAQKHGILPIILAFLDMYPEEIYVEEESEIEDAANESPVPRTWTMFSRELKMEAERTGTKLEVGFNEGEMQPALVRQVAMEFLGQRTAIMLYSFCVLRGNCPIDYQKILEGTEKPSSEWYTKLRDKGEWKREYIFQILEDSIHQLKKDIKTAGLDMMNGVPTELATRIANLINWFLDLQDYEMDDVVNCIKQLQGKQGPGGEAPQELDSAYAALQACAFSNEVCNKCPKLDKFLLKNSDVMAVANGFAI